MLSSRLIPAAAVLVVCLAACGGQVSTASGPYSTSAPAASSSPTPSPTVTAPAVSVPSVMAQNVGANGSILVAGSNHMTVYTFDNDSPGVSTCKGGCATIWPPLTVPQGQTPSPGPGVTGSLATISRGDGSLQVTYKGMPLYFFHNDSKPGDTNGHYTGWELVRP